MQKPRRAESNEQSNQHRERTRSGIQVLVADATNMPQQHYMDRVCSTTIRSLCKGGTCSLIGSGCPAQSQMQLQLHVVLFGMRLSCCLLSCVESAQVGVAPQAGNPASVSLFALLVARCMHCSMFAACSNVKGCAATHVVDSATGH
jgi:hypothetical protein